MSFDLKTSDGTYDSASADIIDPSDSSSFYSFNTDSPLSLLYEARID